jgi:hypothetical protein
MSAQQHKPGAPVVGFNHNLNYKGRVFHVQTEDSGPQHGHTITHIFMGGNILASTRSSYTELLLTIDPGDLFSAVRKLMEDQHKAMMKSLLQGGHDAEILRRTGGTVYEPGVLAGGERAPSLLVGGDRSPTSVPPPVARATSIPPTPPPMPSSLAPRDRSGAVASRDGAQGHLDGDAHASHASQCGVGTSRARTPRAWKRGRQRPGRPDEPRLG